MQHIGAEIGHQQRTFESREVKLHLEMMPEARLSYREKRDVTCGLFVETKSRTTHTAPQRTKERWKAVYDRAHTKIRT